MIELVFVCVGIGSLSLSVINLAINYIKGKEPSLKKHSITIHLDKSTDDFINTMIYLDKKKENTVLSTEIMYIRNNIQNMKLFVPSKKITIDDIEFIPLKNTPTSSISGIIITSDDQQKINNVLKIISKNE
jgi:hypothetical protein